MNQTRVRRSRGLRGTVRLPGDKSISHRAVLLGALAQGHSRVRGFLPSGDCMASLACVRALGISVTREDETSITIHGTGLRGLSSPDGPLDCRRSGTTMRLLSGILAGQEFASTLTGAEQLLRRPMRRIVEPLRRMGAQIRDTDGCAPLKIHGHALHGFDHTLAVPSAQVKSALLLAGLYADGPTVVRQPGPARDHTERMLVEMGATIETQGLTVRLAPGATLSPLSQEIPGDISSAAFLIVAALLVPQSDIILEKVGVNPTRTGLLDVLRDMGGEITLDDERTSSNEPVADLAVHTSLLRSTRVQGQTVVRMIDEFPVFAVAATQAQGTTIVQDAAELRVKETDRIAVIASELQRLGARIEPLSDGFAIDGPTPLRGTDVDSHGDHRLAMALTIAGLVASGETVVRNTDCIADSFPGFGERLAQLNRR